MGNLAVSSHCMALCHSGQKGWGKCSFIMMPFWGPHKIQLFHWIEMNSACNRWWNILVWLYISISYSTCFGAFRWRDWEMQKSCQTGVGNFYYLKEMKGKRWAALLGNHFLIPLWKSRWRKPKRLKRNLKKTTEAEAFVGNCKEAAAQVKLNSWDPWNSWYDRHAEMHSPWRGMWRVSRTDPNSINNMWRQPLWGKVGAHTDLSWSNHKKSESQESRNSWSGRQRERERENVTNAIASWTFLRHMLEWEAMQMSRQ